MSPATDIYIPSYVPIRLWLPANQGCYARFRRWLREGGYANNTINIYGIAVRLTLGVLNKPYWLLDKEADITTMRTLIAAHYKIEATRQGLEKGLRKFVAFLRQTQGEKAPEKEVNWETFIATLPPAIGEEIRGYVRQRQRGWSPQALAAQTSTLLSPLTLFLRWLVTQTTLTTMAEVTPEYWFAYLDARLADGIQGVTLNKQLAELQSFVRYLAEVDKPTCARFLEIDRLPKKRFLPKDVPLDQLRRLFVEIETETQRDHAGVQRQGVMDKAWFLLMLHCGLRTGEVRRLCRADVDRAGKRLRIEQSKGLKDRIVYLSEATVAAIEAYLPIRGSLASDHLFVYRHRPLTVSYCKERLHTVGGRCGVRVTPHQLRHSCATLLLNAGTPILTVQAILGHQKIDTTLAYARLYSGTVAADYYRAMADVEQRLQLRPTTQPPPLTPEQLVTLVDALRQGTLNANQQTLLHDLRTGLLTLAEQWARDGGAE